MDILQVPPRIKKKTEVLAVRMESWILTELKAVAERRGIKASSAARLVIKNFIETHPEVKRRKTA